MKYLRLYADQDGESRIEEMHVAFNMAVYAPPAPAFGVSSPTEAERFVTVHFPAGWDSEPHPAPRRQLFVMLSGRFQGQTSDGALMDLGPGDVILMEDTTGKGHGARPIGGEALAIMIALE